MKNQIGIKCLLILIIQIHADTCGSNCPNNTCNSCICGKTKETVTNTTLFCKPFAWNQNYLDFNYSDCTIWSQ